MRKKAYLYVYTQYTGVFIVSLITLTLIMSVFSMEVIYKNNKDLIETKIEFEKLICIVNSKNFTSDFKLSCNFYTHEITENDNEKKIILKQEKKGKSSNYKKEFTIIVIERRNNESNIDIHTNETNVPNETSETNVTNYELILMEENKVLEDICITKNPLY